MMYYEDMRDDDDYDCRPSMYFDDDDDDYPADGYEGDEYSDGEQDDE